MNNELIGELLQGLTDDVASVKKSLAAQQAPVDYRPSIERMATMVLALQETVARPAAPASPPPVGVSKELEQQLRQAVAEEVRRHHPDRPLTQAVQYGVWVFVGVLALLLASWWGWWNAAAVRDQRERSAWLWRETRQTNPAYTTSVTERWRQDSVKFQEATIRLEERERLLLEAQRKRAEAVVLEKEATAKKAK
ncbi:hypothetical protein [Hymenobacter glacialis]|uniref:Uncharacterized protein n=1 Tax=Hymenobacter glacialis TaxID=1908236 RepID=A0A1G1T3C0_9BACT|nr:hypothetical protein [Hymenobacter glacialis]OGX85383.1 hypothetical protein BEN48_14555 [Hymenobacter glacialis]